MLKRRKLGTRNALMVEYDLSVDIALVWSNQNLADGLARVPQRWFSIVKKETKSKMSLCTGVTNEPKPGRQTDIHQRSKMDTIFRETSFSFSVESDSRWSGTVKCQSIGQVPHPVWWRKNNLNVSESWKRLGKNITNYSFQTLIDYGHTRFSIWRPLLRQALYYNWNRWAVSEPALKYSLLMTQSSASNALDCS